MSSSSSDSDSDSSSSEEEEEMEDMIHGMPLSLNNDNDNHAPPPGPVVVGGGQGVVDGESDDDSEDDDSEEEDSGESSDSDEPGIPDVGVPMMPVGIPMMPVGVPMVPVGGVPISVKTHPPPPPTMIVTTTATTASPAAASPPDATNRLPAKRARAEEDAAAREERRNSRRRITAIAAQIRKLVPEAKHAAAYRRAVVPFARNADGAETDAAAFHPSLGPVHLSADAVRARVTANRAKRSKNLMERHVEGLLRRIQTHRFAPPFNIPVDAEKHGLEDYHTIVTHPMDLGTVRSRLEQGMYDSDPWLFASDVRLTFRNAVAYNPTGTDVRAMAEALWERFEEGWSSVKEKLEAEAAEVASEEAALVRRLAIIEAQSAMQDADAWCTRVALSLAKARRELSSLRASAHEDIPEHEPERRAEICRKASSSLPADVVQAVLRADGATSLDDANDVALVRLDALTRLFEEGGESLDWLGLRSFIQ